MSHNDTKKAAVKASKIDFYQKIGLENFHFFIFSKNVPVLRKKNPKPDEVETYVKIEGGIKSQGGVLLYIDPKGQPYRFKEYLNKENQNIEDIFTIDVELVSKKTRASVVFITANGQVIELPFSIHWELPEDDLAKKMPDEEKVYFASIRKSKPKIDKKNTLASINRPIKKYPKQAAQKLIKKKIASIEKFGYQFDFFVEAKDPGQLSWFPDLFKIKKNQDQGNLAFEVMWAGRSSFDISTTQSDVTVKNHWRSSRFRVHYKFKKSEYKTQLNLKDKTEPYLLFVRSTILPIFPREKVKNLKFEIGLGITSLNFTQTSKPDYSMVALTPKGGTLYQLGNSPWSIGANLYYNAIPISHSFSATQTPMRFFGFNGRVELLTKLLREPWNVRIASGFYYNTVVTNAKQGYTGVAGPLLFPMLSKRFQKSNSAYIYIKYSPLKSSHGIFSFSNNELAIGLGLSFHYVKRLLKLSLDLAQMEFDTLQDGLTTQTRTRSLTLGLGLVF